MSIGSMLYNLIIGPLELLFDAVYSLTYTAFKLTPGLAIVFLSLAINILVLPLYRRADALQEEEREQTLRMKPILDHIRSTFKGDERFMIQQAYYRLNNYKPYYVLKSSLSLLLQIPFFIAAYRFLSGLLLLQGQPFGPIPDLGMPDGLIRVAGLNINLLPVLMTAINIFSGAIYTRGMPLKSKLQLYGMALIFLILLYDSPSGLVFYWTLNNLFSLVKTIFYKLRNPRAVLRWFCSAAGLVVLVFFLPRTEALHRQVIEAPVALLLQLPLVSHYYYKKHPRRAAGSETGDSAALFYVCCLLLVVLTGALIPSAVVEASPAEFVDLSNYHAPLEYVWSAFILAVGAFLVWPAIFYQLSSPRVRPLFSLGMAVLSVTAVLDYMVFGRNYGNMSAALQYDLFPAISRSEYLINSLLLLAAAALLYLLWKKRSRLVRTLAVASCIALTGMAGLNIVSIHKDTAYIRAQAEERVQTDAEGPASDAPKASIPLSRDGKNVVVIMLDRSIGAFVPYMMEEKPELQRQFAGFTYYPNTISYGGFTNVGAVPLFGGYEYIPEEMNRRSDLPLVDKHNEALRVMPLNFLRAGFDVTVCDPPFANYQTPADLSIYDDHPQIRRFNLIDAFSGNEEDGALQETAERLESIKRRNLFCYSIFRSAPLLFQHRLYNEANYNETNALVRNSVLQVVHGVSKATGFLQRFMTSYDSLTHISQIIEVSDDSPNSFVMMTSDVTHEPMLLQEPAYEPDRIVDNTEYDREHLLRRSAGGDALSLTTQKAMTHYHVNMAAFLQLGKWFDYLRENGVYDNTRIILVSDHGRDLGLFDLQLDGSGETYKDVLLYTALLMVKDFDAQEFTTDPRFMTNADTSLLAFDGLVSDPVNEATGRPITDEAKHLPEQHILFTNNSVRKNCGNTFLEDAQTHWLTLRTGTPFDRNNWEVVR